jgi:hypothetical protein
VPISELGIFKFKTFAFLNHVIRHYLCEYFMGIEIILLGPIRLALHWDRCLSKFCSCGGQNFCQVTKLYNFILNLPAGSLGAKMGIPEIMSRNLCTL